MTSSKVSNIRKKNHVKKHLLLYVEVNNYNIIICIINSTTRPLNAFKVNPTIELTKESFICSDKKIHSSLSCEEMAKWRRAPVVAQVCTAELFPDNATHSGLLLSAAFARVLQSHTALKCD